MPPGLVDATQVLDLDGEYFGGEMGDMDVVWKRVTIDDESGEAVAVETLVTSATLTLGPADLSHFIEAAVVPIRDDGVRGKEVTVRSERRVKPCAPSGTLALPEQSADGMPIVPTCTYRGGKEGNSTFAWYNAPPVPPNPGVLERRPGGVLVSASAGSCGRWGGVG